MKQATNDIQFDNQGLWKVAGDDVGKLTGEAQAHESVKDKINKGLELRATVPREIHALWKPAADRRSPVEILTAQDAARQPDLVPLRYGRMLVSPFTFYRGAAAVMAADLAGGDADSKTC